MDNQAYIFLLFILNGILIGVLFDIFRVLRKSFKTSDFITYLEDILFWIIAGLVTIYFLFVFNKGEIRFYIFLGICLGIVVYMLSISKHFITINVKIITVLKTIVMKVISILLFPLKQISKIIQKLCFRPISFICINVKKFFVRNKLKIVNNMKKMHNPRKNPIIKKDF